MATRPNFDINDPFGDIMPQGGGAPSPNLQQAEQGFKPANLKFDVKYLVPPGMPKGRWGEPIAPKAQEQPVIAPEMDATSDTLSQFTEPAGEMVGKAVNAPFVPLQYGVEKGFEQIRPVIKPMMQQAFPKATEKEIDMVLDGAQGVTELALIPSYLKLVGAGAKILAKAGKLGFYKFAPDWMFPKGEKGLPVPLSPDEVINRLKSMSGKERAEMVKKYPQFREAAEEMWKQTDSVVPAAEAAPAAKPEPGKPILPTEPGFTMQEAPETGFIMRPGEPTGNLPVQAASGERALVAPETSVEPPVPPPTAPTSEPKPMGRGAGEGGMEGRGEYHGTSSKIDYLEEYTYNPFNLYGPGFYTTDNKTVAEGYSKKGRGKEPTVYDIKWQGKGNPNLLDLEKPLEGKALEIFEGQKEFNDYLPADLRNKPVREIYKEMQENMRYEGVTAEEAEGLMSNISEALLDAGYDGFMHIGGRYPAKPGKPEHQVKIYFEPQKLQITEPQPAPPEKGGEGKEPWEMTYEDFRDAIIEKKLGKVHNNIVRLNGMDIANESQVKSYFKQLRKSIQGLNQNDPKIKTINKWFDDAENQYYAGNIKEAIRLSEEGLMLEHDNFELLAEMLHEGAIEKALTSGKPVPSEVLADYPDLAAKYAPDVAKSATTDLSPEVLTARAQFAQEHKVAPELLEYKGSTDEGHWFSIKDPEHPQFDSTGIVEGGRKKIVVTSPKQQKAYAIDKLDDALQGPFKDGGGPNIIQINIPDDGEFSIINDKAILEKVRKNFAKLPTTEPKPISYEAKPQGTPKPLGTRNALDSIEDLEYYSPKYSPKKTVLEAGEGKATWQDGYYSTGNLLIKMPNKPKGIKSDHLKWQSKEKTLKSYLEDTFAPDATMPAEIEGEFKPAHDKQSVVIFRAGTTRKAVAAKFLDGIYAEHPDAKPFLSDNPDRPVVFKINETPVAAVGGYNFHEANWKRFDELRAEPVPMDMTGTDLLSQPAQKPKPLKPKPGELGAKGPDLTKRFNVPKGKWGDPIDTEN